MRLKAPLIGCVLAIAGLFLAAGGLAVFIPHIVDSQPVRARLLQELHNWTGGDVMLSGPVTVSSFFSVSVEAQSLKVAAPGKLPRITSISAGKVVARLSWVALLTGNIDFDKVKIQNAVIEVESADIRESANAMLAMLSGPRGASFGTLTVSDSIIALRERVRQPYRRLTVTNAVASLGGSSGRVRASGAVMWRGQPLAVSLSAGTAPQTDTASRVPVRLRLDSPLLNASFDGEANISDVWGATGAIDARTTDMAALATWAGVDIEAGIVPREGGAVKAALNVAHGGISLQDAELSLGGLTATGNLSLARKEELPEVEGSLAFSSLNLDAVFAGGPRPPRLVRSFVAAFSRVDLRISADTMRWQNIETGAAAFALTSQPGALSLEVADLTLMDGAVRGQIVADTSADPIRAQARLSVENVNAGALLEVFHQRDWLTGRADADVEAEMEWTAAHSPLESATARVSVAFTEGGRIRLDIPRLAGTAPDEALNGWDGVDLTQADFNELRFKLILQGGLLTCNSVEMSSADDIVNGTGSIDLPKGALNWSFSVSPRGPGDEFARPVQAINVGSRPGLSIRGTVAYPTISSGRLIGSGGGGDAVPSASGSGPLGAAGAPGAPVVFEPQTAVR